MKSNILAQLISNTKYNPHKLAILDKSGRYTYAHLLSRINGLSQRLSTHLPETSRSGESLRVLHLTDADVNHVTA